MKADPHAALAWPGSKPLVVMLHNAYPVITRGDVFEGWNASTRQIRRFIDYVVAHFQVIDLDGYRAALESGQGRGQILFTCDDGYAQMLREIGDFLHERQIRPALFLISGLQTGEVVPWYYQLALFFRRTTLTSIDYGGASHSITTCAEKTRLYRQIQGDLLATGSVQEFQQLLKTVTAIDGSIDYGRLDADMRPLSDGDVAHVLSRGWTIGCHGHSHIPFSLMSDEELECEIETARSRLLQRYGVTPNVISYPNGAIKPEQLAIVGKWFRLGFMAAPQPDGASVLQCGRLAFPEDREMLLQCRWHSPRREAASSITPTRKRLSDATCEVRASDIEAQGKPRVVIMSGPLYPERALVARVGESATLVGVFVHNYTGEELTYLNVPADSTTASVAHLARQDVIESGADAIWQFGWSSQYFCLRPAVTVYETSDINDPAIASLVEVLRPDVILVFGTGLIRNPRLLSLPVPKYNLHWGISPYYRGSYTLRWPILNDDPEKLGVTIHELDERIDGGPLVAQHLLDLDGSERPQNVEYEASHAGITLLLEIVRVMGEGCTVTATDQDLSLGRLYRINEWSPDRDEATDIRLECGFAARARRSRHREHLQQLELASPDE